MCFVSMISDYGNTRIPIQDWTPNTFSDYQKILRKLAELDEKLGQPDCEDPEKLRWMNDIEERLKKLETKSQNTR